VQSRRRFDCGLTLPRSLYDSSRATTCWTGCRRNRKLLADYRVEATKRLSPHIVSTITVALLELRRVDRSRPVLKIQHRRSGSLSLCRAAIFDVQPPRGSQAQAGSDAEGHRLLSWILCRGRPVEGQFMPMMPEAAHFARRFPEAATIFDHPAHACTTTSSDKLARPGSVSDSYPSELRSSRSCRSISSALHGPHRSLRRVSRGPGRHGGMR